MELDFKTVKALSSPTRIRILNQVLEQESTPTALSENLDRSKSTVSSHLDTLVDADLVEKDKEEGRRRVIYRPTGKAEDIVRGKEKRVKFSLASSFVSAFAGVALVGSQVVDYTSGTVEDRAYLQEDSPGVMAETAETAPAGGQEFLLDPSTAVLAFGLFFITVSALALIYGLVMRRIGR